MKIKFILLFVFVIIQSVNAQTQFELKCQGKVPQEILSSIKEAYASDVTTIKGHKNKKVQKEYYLETNAFLDELLKSGSILFGDSISDYVNKVGVELLKNHQELQGKIKFFVYRSPYVNAFSTQKGYIFINIGLIAQLDDEAQLAYILAHEIVHFMKNHGINQYVENRKMEDKKGGYKKMDENQKEFLYYYRSKTDEFEADTLGLSEFIIQSKYSLQSSSKVFDILLYSDFHYLNLKFEPNYFDFEKYSMPRSYFVDTVNPIIEKEDYDDIKETHPNIKRRREAFNKMATRYQDTGRITFIVSENTFNAVRNLARMELMRLEMLYSNPAKVFYSTFVLRKNGLNNDFITYTYDYALYAVFKGKILGSVDENLSNAGTEMGEIQQVYQAFSKIGGEELCLLSLCNLVKNKENKSFESMYPSLIRNLAQDLIDKYDYMGSKFINSSEEDENGFKFLSASEYKALNKLEQIKYDKKVKDPGNRYIYGKNVKELKIYLSKNKYFMQIFDSLEILSNSKKYISKDKYMSNNGGKRKEPINNLIVYSPEYNYYWFNEYNPLQSEKSQVQYLKSLEEVCHKINIKYHILSSNYLTSNNVDLYNDLYTYDCWISEISVMNSKGKFSNNSFGLVPFSQYMVDDYFKKVGTSTILLSEGNLSVRNREGRISILISSIILFPLLPVGAYTAFTNEQLVEINNLCIDGSLGKVHSYSSVQTAFANRMTLFKAYNYRYLKNLKHGDY